MGRGRRLGASTANDNAALQRHRVADRTTRHPWRADRLEPPGDHVERGRAGPRLWGRVRLGRVGPAWGCSYRARTSATRVRDRPSGHHRPAPDRRAASRVRPRSDVTKPTPRHPARVRLRDLPARSLLDDVADRTRVHAATRPGWRRRRIEAAAGHWDEDLKRSSVTCQAG